MPRISLWIEGPNETDYEVDLKVSINDPEPDVGYNGGLEEYIVEEVIPRWLGTEAELDAILKTWEETILEKAFEAAEPPDYD